MVLSVGVPPLDESARYRLLVEAISDYAIYMLDREGRVASWNPGAERFKGYRASEILGEHFSRFYTTEDKADGLPERALSTAANEGRFENEGWRVRKDGTRFWAHVVIDPVFDPDGQLLGYAKVTRDLTERKKTEDALKRSEQALAQANEELMQSQKLEAICRLTGGIAHDFNNLLMAISGSLELLRKRLPNDPALMRLVDNAMQGTRRGASLTQRMLAFARRQDLKPEQIDVLELIEGMTELLQRSLGPSIEIQTRIPQGLSRILADANQLELALLNLAVNAKDAMEDGGQLTLTATESTAVAGDVLAPGRYVSIALTDTGTGMDAETLSHATEPFFTTKGIGKGTGLGLAMVRGLTEQSGGGLTIDSAVGKGTTVTLWIPVSEDGVAELAASVSEIIAPAAPKRLRVLVVDDDFLVAMNTTAMLEDLGHDAVEVHSGKQALEALQNEGDFDLMITDQAMPQMTGTQLVSAARLLKPDLPVILATGYAELPPGADNSLPRLSKPFMQAQLEAAVAASIAR